MKSNSRSWSEVVLEVTQRTKVCLPVIDGYAGHVGWNTVCLVTLDITRCVLASLSEGKSQTAQGYERPVASTRKPISEFSNHA